MITVNKKEITVIIPHQNKIYIAGSRSCGENDFSEALLPNHRNQKINLLLRNHRNQFTKKTRGQSIAEYAILISVVSLALLAMQVYMKRSIQSVVKYSTDQFGSQDWFERDPKKGVLQNTTLLSTQEASRRIQQQPSGSSFTTTYTTNASYNNTGESVYFREGL